MKKGKYTHPKVKQVIHLVRKLDDYLEHDSPVNNWMSYQVMRDLAKIFGDLNEEIFAAVANDKLEETWEEN